MLCSNNDHGCHLLYVGTASILEEGVGNKMNLPTGEASRGQSGSGWESASLHPLRTPTDEEIRQPGHPLKVPNYRAAMHS